MRVLYVLLKELLSVMLPSVAVSSCSDFRFDFA